MPDPPVPADVLSPMAALTDAAPDPLLLVALDGRVLHANPAWTELVSAPPAIYPPEALLHPDDRERARLDWDRTPPDAPDDGTYRLRDARGTHRAFVTHLRPVVLGGRVALRAVRLLPAPDSPGARPADTTLRPVNVVALQWSSDAAHVEWFGDASALFGTPPATLNELRERLHPDDRRVFDDARSELRHHGSEFAGRLRVVRPDGGTRQVHAHVLVRRDPLGAATVTFGALTDVTDLVAALTVEHAARRAADAEQERLDALFESAPPSIGLAFLDARLRYTHVSRSLAVINGAPVEAHLHRRVHDVVPHLVPQIEGALTRVVRDRRPALNVSVVEDDPEGRAWLAHYYPVQGARGELVGVGALVLDVTAQHRSAEEREALLERLAAERRRFDAVLGGLPTGVIVRDATTERVTFANAAAEVLLGTSVPAGTAWSRVAPGLAHLDGRPLAWDERPEHKAASGHVAPPAEVVLVRPDGTGVTCVVSAAPLRRASGGVYAVVIALARLSGPDVERSPTDGPVTSPEAFVNDFGALSVLDASPLERRLAALLHTRPGGVSLTEAARGLDVSKVAVSKVARDMARRGDLLVERHPASREHRFRLPGGRYVRDVRRARDHLAATAALYAAVLRHPDLGETARATLAEARRDRDEAALALDRVLAPTLHRQALAIREHLRDNWDAVTFDDVP